MRFTTWRSAGLGGLLSGVSFAALAVCLAPGAARAADCTADAATISADCTNYTSSGTIATLSNTATISAPIGAGETRALDNSGTITTLVNDGTISAVNSTAHATHGLDNSGTITTLDNNGTITGTIDHTKSQVQQVDGVGVYNAASGVIGTIDNDGTISGTVLGESYFSLKTYGIANEGSIGSIVNDGDILGKFGIASNVSGSKDPTVTISEIHNHGTINGIFITLADGGVVETIENTGTLRPLTDSVFPGALVLFGGAAKTITNSGTIGDETGQVGTFILNTAVDTLTNDGTIAGTVGVAVTSVDLGGGPNLAKITTLDNRAGGKITGTDAALTVFGSSIGTLDNAGELSTSGEGTLLATLASTFGLTLPDSLSGPGNGAIVAIRSTIGSIGNSGKISASSSGFAAAVLSLGSDIESIDNGKDGTLSASGSLALGVGMVGGSIDAVSNEGAISATGVGDGSMALGVTTLGPAVFGVDGPATAVGTFENTGTVEATGAIALGGLFALASADSFTNSGTMSGAGTVLGGGLMIASSDIGSFENSGTLDGTGPYSGGLAIIGLGDLAKNLGDADLTGPLGGADNPALALISGLGGAALATPTTIDSLDNSGTISGGLLGLYVGGGATVGPIENSGTIESGSVALYVDGGATIGDLDNSGTITGPEAIALYGDAAFGTITNSGTIAGTIKNGTSSGLVFIGATGDDYGLITGYSADPATLVTGLIDSRNAGVTFQSGSMRLNSDIDVGTGTVTNDATLRLDDAVSITGNYSQSAAARLVIAATRNAMGQLTVSGSAGLAGSGIVIVPIGGYHFAGDIATILSAGTLDLAGTTVKVGTETITFTTETVDGVTRILADLPDQGPSSAYSEIGGAAGPAGAAMGATLDVLAGGESDEAIAFQSTVLTTLLALDDADQPQAIAELAPSGDTPGWQAGFTAGTLFGDAVGQRQFGGFGAGAPAPSPVSGYAEAAPQRGNEAWRALTGTATAGRPGEGFDGEVWLQGLGGVADGPGYDMKGGGLAFGADVALSDSVLIGAAGSWLSLDTDASAAEASQRLYQALLYASWRAGAFHLDAQAGGSYGEIEQSRRIGFLGAVARSDFDGVGATARAEAGYDLALAAGGPILTPLAGIAFQRSVYDPYRETGAGAANLSVDGQDVNSLTSTLGAKLAWPIDTGFGRWTPEVRAVWLHDYLDDPVVTTGTLAGTPFVTETDRLAADGAEIGAALTLESGRLLFGGEYVGQFRSGYQSHAGLAKGALRF